MNEDSQPWPMRPTRRSATSLVPLSQSSIRPRTGFGESVTSSSCVKRPSNVTGSARRVAEPERVVVELLEDVDDVEEARTADRTAVERAPADADLDAHGAPTSGRGPLSGYRSVSMNR